MNFWIKTKISKTIGIEKEKQRKIGGLKSFFHVNLRLAMRFLLVLYFDPLLLKFFSLTII
jgi:hypothetical protein